MQSKKLRNILISFIVLLICLVSFIGIYVQNKNEMVNIIPEYLLGINLKGGRFVELKVNNEKNTVIKDKDGNIVEDTKNSEGNEMSDEELKQKEYTKTEEPINPEEKLTKENYEKSKQIIEKRLKFLEVTDYIVTQNELGNILIQSEENDKTDNNMQIIYNTGKFEIKDSDDNTVLLTNKDIKSSNVVYSNGTSNGTIVGVQIIFTKDGTKKLEDITKKYVTTTAEDGTETTKEVKLEIDDQELTEMSFNEPNTNGILQLSVGTATTDEKQLNNYIAQAKNLAMILSFENLPITYEQANNEYIASDITLDKFEKVVYIILAIIVVALLVLIVKCKEKGILGAISFIGFIAVLLLIIRYSNVIVTIEGIIALITISIINYIFIFNVSKKEYTNKDMLKKENAKEFLKIINVLVPIGIIGITFSFADWQPIISLGMILFWGIACTLIYNLLVTKTLLSNSIKKD